MSRRLFVPTLVDAENVNAQVLNARAIFGGWDAPGWEVLMHSYFRPDEIVAANPRIRVTRLWRRRAWTVHLFLRYLRRYDLIFYPGIHAMDIAGLRWRRRLGLACPVVATVEALGGDDCREARYTESAGHPVYCDGVSAAELKRLDEYYRLSDHIIAISPFLARMEQARLGREVTVLPLGIDASIYYPATRERRVRPVVVGAGSVKARKRPDVFIDLACRFPDADFVWYGEGDMRAGLVARAERLALSNVSFPGALQPRALGAALRAADIFVLPSKSEGVPKVTQEAAACGLAQVIFGYYEAPSVQNGQNGFVAWSDDEFMKRVGELIDDPGLVEKFGRAGVEMARAWEWGRVAPLWREQLIKVATAR